MMNENQIKLLKTLYYNAYFSLKKIDDSWETEETKIHMNILLKEIQDAFQLDSSFKEVTNTKSDFSPLFINQNQSRVIRKLIEVYQMDDYFTKDEHPYSVPSTLRTLAPLLMEAFHFSYEEDFHQVPYQNEELYELLSEEGLVQKEILKRIIWVHPKHIVFDENKNPTACVTSLNDRQLKSMYFVFGAAYVKGKLPMNSNKSRFLK